MTGKCDNQVIGLEKALSQARVSHNILFCGAGFPAKCENHQGEYLPTGSKLKDLLNNKIGNSKCKELGTAAQAFKNKFTSYELLKLLKETYSVKNISQEVRDVLEFPWSVIYTTNYDNAIQMALTRNGVHHQIMNNRDNIDELKKNNIIPVIHLHGCVEKWDPDNFDRSCVLDLSSYSRITKNNLWLDKLNADYERARNIFFIGFSNSDIYIRDSLYGRKENRNRVFFINSQDAINDEDLKIKQEELGTPCSIGISHFAEMVNQELKKGKMKSDLVPLENFKQVSQPVMAKDRATLDEQKNFIYKGKKDSALHYKDIYDGSRNYRIPRDRTEEALLHLKKDNACCLISGSMCCGKTSFVEELIIHLSLDENEKVFRLVNKFDNIESEIDTIFEFCESPIFVIDDCFSSSSEWLEKVLNKIRCKNARILLASRSLAKDAEKSIVDILGNEYPFIDIDLSKLTEKEISELIEYVSRMGQWKVGIKKRIKKNNQAKLSSVLVDLFKSEHLINEFKKSLELIGASDPNFIEIVVMVIYLKSCDITLNSTRILGTILDFDDVFDSINGPEREKKEWIRISEETNEIQTIASINGRESLHELFKNDNRIIVDLIYRAISNIQEFRFYDVKFQDIYKKLIKYTNLKQVIPEPTEQEHFFDKLTEFKSCTRDPLFWLQYSIAMQECFAVLRRKNQLRKQSMNYLNKANDHINTAYECAKGRGSYVTWQLDDHKAALLLEEAIGFHAINDDKDLPQVQSFKLNAFLEATGLMKILLNRSVDKQSQHPYYKIIEFFPEFFKDISEDHKGIYIEQLNKFKTTSVKNCEKIKKHYKRETYVNVVAEKAINVIVNCLDTLNLEQN